MNRISISMVMVVTVLGSTPAARAQQIAVTVGNDGNGNPYPPAVGMQLTMDFNNLMAQCRMGSMYFRNVTDMINAGGNDVNGNPKAAIQVVLVKSRRNIFVDSFGSNEVDMDDIADYPRLDPPNIIDRCQHLLHILWERYYESCYHTGFAAAHADAILRENAYRMALGYKDSLVRATAGPGGDKACYEWSEPGKPNVTTYVPFADQRQEGRVEVNNVTTLVDGSTQYTVTIDQGYPNVDELVLPSMYGGGMVTITNYTGTAVLERRPSDDPRYDRVKFVSMNITVPPVPLPPPAMTTGINHLTLDPLGPAYGFFSRENGQLAVAYTGNIVNDLYPPMAPLQFYGLLTAELHEGDLLIRYHTAAALLDGESGQEWSHDAEHLMPPGLLPKGAGSDPGGSSSMGCACRTGGTRSASIESGLEALIVLAALVLRSRRARTTSTV